MTKQQKGLRSERSLFEIINALKARRTMYTLFDFFFQFCASVLGAMFAVYVMESYRLWVSTELLKKSADSLQDIVNEINKAEEKKASEQRREV